MTIKQQIERSYNAEMMKIVPDDPCAESKKYCIGQKRAIKIDALDSMIAKKKKKKIRTVNKKQMTIFKIQTQK